MLPMDSMAQGQAVTKKIIVGDVDNALLITNVDNGEEASTSNVVYSRKRKRRQEHLYKRNIAKRKVECGEARLTPTGKMVNAVRFEGVLLCKCKIRCASAIDLERQQQIFNSYWKETTHRVKQLFIRENVRRVPIPEKSQRYILQPIKRLRTRQFNYKYSFKNDEGVTVNVCKSFFLGCLKITGSVVYRAIESVASNPCAIDMRGKKSSPNKTPESRKDTARRFIRRLPKYESHYSRKTTNREYLAPGWNMTKLFKAYEKYCEENEDGEKVKRHCFFEIFDREYNIALKKPHSDTCKTCDHLESVKQSSCTSLEEKDAAENEHTQHLSVVTTFLQNLEIDRKDASNNNQEITVLTFDLQKALETPSLTTSVAYYKRQLWTYNLCIHDEVLNKGYMYVWSEDVASRGGQEIASCLLYHLKNKIPPSTKRIILYSDACGGQNRNIKVTVMLKHFLENSSVESIEQKFFVSGHSYNSCDRHFGLIEKEKKLREQIFTPEDWVELISNTRKSEPKFDVTVMEKQLFFSSTQLERNITNRKFDLSKAKISWLKARKLVYNRGNPFQFEMHNNEVVQIVNIAKRNVTRVDFKNLALNCLYPNGRPITKAKYNDLQCLKCFINKKYHSFYDNLKFDSKAKDYGIASDISEEED